MTAPRSNARGRSLAGRPRFLMVGIASEFSTRPLAEALRQRGYPVSVVDLAEDELTAASVPAGRGPLVVVTSQHLGMTGRVYDEFYSLSSHYVAPQTVRAKTQADLMVYVPHDRDEPVLASEVELLQTMDLFIAPDDDWWWADDCVPTVNCGWVGSLVSPASLPDNLPIGEGVFFPGLISWLLQLGGADYFLSAFARTLATGVAVKFAVWPGLEDIMDALRTAGVPVIDPSVSASALIARVPRVITNGPTSVVAEAVAAGHRPICVVDPVMDQHIPGYLSGYDLAMCRDEDMPEALSRGGVVREPEDPFDVDRFLRAVRTGLRHA